MPESTPHAATTVQLALYLECTSAEVEAASNVRSQEWEQWFSLWGADLLDAGDLQSGNYELTLRLMDDEEIRALNAQFRDRDSATDVLSFAALEAAIPAPPPDWPAAEPTYLGDIAISVPTAIRQARERGHSTRYELAWLAAHGLLHLLGWDHPDAASLDRMLARQATLLHLLPAAL